MGPSLFIEEQKLIQRSSKERMTMIEKQLSRKTLDQNMRPEAVKTNSVGLRREKGNDLKKKAMISS